MKKGLLLLSTILISFFAFSQVNKIEEQSALSLIKNNAKIIGLTDNDMSEFQISSTYLRPGTNIRMVYLLQTYKGIPVFNKMQVLAFKDNKLVSNTGGRVLFIDQKIKGGVDPKTTSEQAIQAALLDQGIYTNIDFKLNRQEGIKKYYGNLGVANNDISAELVWLPINDKEIRLTWQIELAPLKSSDHFLIRVDAETNKVLDKNNYTVYEQLNNKSESSKKNPYQTENKNTASEKKILSPSVVSNSTYKVVAFPSESPSHVGGTPSVVSNPWLLAGSTNATSLGWHFDGTSYKDSTRGNNVWAQEDRDNNNNTYGKVAKSTTAQPSLTLEYTPNFSLAPTDTTYQRFVITNLFYWNNITHDLLYNYGFDEVSGNFQFNNQSRGGLGNDYVIADAQDAGGTNNANFATPVDGSAPRMQMYIFNYTTPNRDGDLDNGVITHEYGHGLSNRLTGGPANSSCLSNAEQGGEGWSDYIALMTTTDWTTASATDGQLAHPIGTYVLGQATTGAGIRTYPYSTNMTINPWTYGMMTGSGGEVHKIGEIWCAVLWDMTWELIAIDGINTNIFNASGVGGNSAALKLVVEGMRLQPCSPGYIDARNAILKADTLFFGGKYSCAIWKAFARRGMGKFASQGSSNSTTDQTADYTDNGSLNIRLSQNVTSQYEGGNITYTTQINAGNCSGISNYVLRDTLPTNVTYVSGGVYDSITRVVSFPVNIGVGLNQSYSFTIKVNNGAYYPAIQVINESVAAASISNFWTVTSSSTTNWVTSTAQSTSAPNSLFTSNLTTLSDQKIETTNSFVVPASMPLLSFQGYINSESGWDGGVVEISNNNGSTWTDLSAAMIAGGYNGSLGTSTSALSGRAAFTGNSNGFVKTIINLSSYSNQSVKLRFRFASDASVAATGWYIDDVKLFDSAQIKMKAVLFNGSNVKIGSADTVTGILQSTICIPASITVQPTNKTVCNTTNTSFSVVASGSLITYQWQVSTDAGLSFVNISGTNSATYNLTSVNTSSNNNQYRCLLNNACTVDLISSAATLTVVATPSAPVANSNARCGTGSVSISATSGLNETVNWYAAATGGTALLLNNSVYATPSISTNTTYYAEASNGVCSSLRTAVLATINSVPAAVTTVANSTKCGPDTTTISATATTGNTIDWYADSTTSLVLQSGTLTGLNKFITPVLSATTNYWVTNRTITSGCSSTTRKKVIATINPKPTAPSVTNGARCGTGTVALTATLPTNPAGTVIWYSVSTGGTSVSTSASYTTPSIATTTSYYVEAKTTATACVSATRSVAIATINSIPAVSVAVNGSRCGTGTVLVSATPASGLTIDWYSAATNGTLLLSGNLNYTTPSITSTKSYYATSRNASTGCISASRTVVAASVIAVLAAPSTLTGTTSICPIVGTATGATYSSASVTGATSYAWTIPTGAVIDSGSNGVKVKVRFVTAGTKDSIYVQAFNGCYGSKKVLKLVTTGCATTPFAKSSNHQFLNENKFSFSVSPNPTHGEINLIFHSLEIGKANLRLFDLQGRLLLQKSIAPNEKIIFGNEIKSGNYFIEIQQGVNKATQSLIKL